MKILILRTDGSWAGLIGRLVLGAVMLPHGLQKTLGWFGGHGFSGTMGFFTEQLGIPWVVALLVIVAESAGALGLIAGFLTRLSALGILAVMAGAIRMAHFQNGFFMNWSGSQAGEGFEYHILAAGLAAILLVTGGGRWSVDGALAGKRRR